MDTNAKDDDNEKQCRICLAGPEEEQEYGRLIKPCLCRGSQQYVHVKCLNRWRETSGSQSAFYSCGTCHYRYAFARTRVVGLATSPPILVVASLLLFTTLVFATSFIVSYFIPSLAAPTYTLEKQSIGSFLKTPLTVANDVIRLAVRYLSPWFVYEYTSDTGFRRANLWESQTPFGRSLREPAPVGLMGRLLHRFFVGLSALGSVSFVSWMYQASLIGPLRLLGWRSNNRNRSESMGTVVTLLLIGVVVIGVARALSNVYKMSKYIAKRILSHAEVRILEVP